MAIYVVDNSGNLTTDNNGAFCVVAPDPNVPIVTTFDDRLRETTARALLNVLRARYSGVPNIQYSAAGDPFQPLYASIGDANVISADELDADTDQESRSFEIPLQRDPVTGEQLFPRVDENNRPYILTADKILWAGVSYAVQSFSVTAQGGLFIVNTIDIRPTVLGIQSK